MKKLYIFLTVFFLTTLSSNAQHYADKWYFGGKAALDFSTGIATVITTSQMAAGEGSASIADPASGDLLFYTDGIHVWNRNNDTMPNGYGLAGGISSTQAALIVPRPGSTTEFYIFTTAQAGEAPGLRYSLVDMAADDGLGDITSKNLLLVTPVAEKVAAVKQPGTDEYWLVTHGWGDNTFYAYKVGTSGISSAVISNVGIVHSDAIIQNSYGQMKFTPCGDKLALAAGYLDKVEIFDFDVTTGVVSNPKTIPYADHVYGLEFSVNGKVLYVSTYQSTATLLQYNLETTNLQQMIDGAQVLSTTPDIYPLQRAPDGRIYCCRSFAQFLGVINSPNSVGGSACDYQENAIDLDPAFLGTNSVLGLPHFVSSQMGGTANCLGTGGLSENLFDNATVFPNPTNGSFTLETEAGEFTVIVSDASGRELEHVDFHQLSGSITFGQDYCRGIYFVRLSDTFGNVKCLKVEKRN